MPEREMAVEKSVEDLVEPALATLGRMAGPSGLLCYEIAEGVTGPRGESVRYTLISLLGLLRAEAVDIEVPLDVAALVEAVDLHLGGDEVTPGDIGLRLWVEARRDGDGADALLDRLALELSGPGSLNRLEGMEVAWIVIGLALTAASHSAAAQMLAGAIDQLVAVNQAPSGLLRHFGAAGARRRFPNFASEIYGVLALAIVARLGLDERALPAARRIADVLLALQLPDGGWPWIYDAERGTVVERYEVYSVHQHGMAPMALRELSAVSGDSRYAAAAASGERWLFGANELGADLAPLHTGMTYRSIRRRAPLDRAALYANTFAVRLGWRPLVRGGAAAVELNRTCRSYELGWLVEAALTGRAAVGRTG